MKNDTHHKLELLHTKDGIEYYSLDRHNPSWIGDALRIYTAAMRYSHLIIELQEPVWRGHMQQHNGATVVGAYALDKLIGITYGFPGNIDNWWCIQLRKTLAANNMPQEEIDAITHDYFELTEIHVLPEMQGRGIGEKLLTLVLDKQQYSKVLLSTPEVAGEANSAWRFYRKHGFCDVLRNMHFPGDMRSFAILAAPLPFIPIHSET